jgi:hypothetical protein
LRHRVIVRTAPPVVMSIAPIMIGPANVSRIQPRGRFRVPKAVTILVAMERGAEAPGRSRAASAAMRS